jgi:AcrR family transcriptional regulator
MAERKKKIILTAIDIICGEGIGNLSISKIAEKEGISKPALYNHFKDKNDLILSILDYFYQFDIEINEKVKNDNLNTLEALALYLELYGDYFESNPSLISIVSSYNELEKDPNISQKLNKLNKFRQDIIIDIIERGKSKGEVKTSIESEEIKDLITGYGRIIIKKWQDNKCGEKLRDFMRDKIITVVKIIFESNT